MLTKAYIFGFFSTCQIVKVRPNNNTFETQIGFLYTPKVTMKLQVFVKDLPGVKYHCIQGVKDLQGITRVNIKTYLNMVKKPQKFYMNLFVKLSNFSFVFCLSLDWGWYSMMYVLLTQKKTSDCGSY